MKLSQKWILDENRVRILSWCARFENRIAIEKAETEYITRKKKPKKVDPRQMTLDLSF